MWLEGGSLREEYREGICRKLAAINLKLPQVGELLLI
jgi:hypothetical protein